MRRHLLLIPALYTTACNPGDFDKAVEKAPVRSIGRPGGFASDELGRVVLPLPPPKSGSGISARFLAAGTTQASLALVEVSPTGKVKARNITDSSVEDLLLRRNTPIGSMALLENGKVLLGAPGFGATGDGRPAAPGRLLVLGVQETSDGLMFDLKPPLLEVEKGRFGLAVAAGRISGAPEEDHVALSEDQVVLIEDPGSGKAALFSDATCSVEIVGLPASYSFRALVVGDLLAAEGDEIAVGVPQNVTPGKVVVFTKTGANLACPVTINPPATAGDGRARFGASLATADLNGDEHKDLIVGAPPNRVFVYHGPIGAAAMPAKEIEGPGGDFGLRVSVMDVDGKLGPEIVVAAPDTRVSGKAGAGQVHVRGGDGSVLVPEIPPLADGSAEEGGGFGQTVTELPFAAPECDGKPAALHRLVLVGAPGELFVYFRLPGAERDPRCFGKLAM